MAATVPTCPGSARWAMADQVGKAVQTTLVWEYHWSSTMSPTVSSVPPKVTVAPGATPRSPAAVLLSTTLSASTGAGARRPAGSTPKTATLVVPPACPALPACRRLWLIPRASARATPSCRAQSPTCPAVIELSVKEASGSPVPAAPKAIVSTGPAVPWASAAPSWAMDDVDWLPSPAVRPESITSSRVIRATTPPIRANLPLAKRMSRMARNTFSSFAGDTVSRLAPVSTVPRGVVGSINRSVDPPCGGRHADRRPLCRSVRGGFQLDLAPSPVPDEAVGDEQQDDPDDADDQGGAAGFAEAEDDHNEGHEGQPEVAQQRPGRQDVVAWCLSGGAQLQAHAVVGQEDDGPGEHRGEGGDGCDDEEELVGDPEVQAQSDQ